MAIVIHRIIAENAVIEVLCVLTYFFTIGICVLFFFTDADLIFYPFYVFL